MSPQGAPAIEVDPFAPAAAAGIDRIAVPTSFAVGPVNAYLIEDEPLTLVDTGPNAGFALDGLERGLAGLGRSLEEIELVIVTHQHIDHLGLVAAVADRSGAEVAALDGLVPYVERYAECAAADDEFGRRMLHRHGVAEEVVTSSLRSFSAASRDGRAGATVTRPLQDGEEIRLRRRTLRAIHRPGHSPTDTVFHDAEHRILLGADHLLGHISSNALISRPPQEGAPRPQPLVRYLDSLRATREMDIDLVLPGHGDPVLDHRALIDARLPFHERRAEKLHGLLVERSRTAHELARAIWGREKATAQPYLTTSEVLGHVDLLLNAGRVTEQEGTGGVVRFRAV